MYKTHLECCIIGSFRKYYNEVITAIDLLSKSNINVLSPKRSKVIRDDDGFVILETDSSELSHVDIQLKVFHRAFRSDFIYVWDPDGYVGRTTCYEIGRLEEKGIPIFYLHRPLDLPVHVPANAIQTIPQLLQHIKQNNGVIPLLNEATSEITQNLISRLASEDYYI